MSGNHEPPDPDGLVARARLSPSQRRAVRGLRAAGWEVEDLATLYHVSIADVELVLAERKRRRRKT